MGSHARLAERSGFYYAGHREALITSEQRRHTLEETKSHQ